MNFDPHPALAGFPVVLSVCVFVLLLIEHFCSESYRLAVSHALTANVFLLAIFSAAAFLSGYYSEGYVGLAPETPSAELVAFHHSVARISLFAAILCAIFRGVSLIATELLTVWRSLFLVSVLTVITFSVYAGYLGGELVFTHHIGLR